MLRLSEIIAKLQEIAPLRLAENWDNVGLLAGDQAGDVQRVMTCLTVTDVVLEEAIKGDANLIVTHHPIPFKPLNRITSETPTGRILWRAIRHGIAIYSPHTAWDNAPLGINRQLAAMLDLKDIRPINPAAQTDLAEQGLGTGIVGEFSSPMSIADVWQSLRKSIPNIQPRTVGDPARPIRRLGIVCGSGASLLGQTTRHACDGFLTGEATYHQCLEAESYGMALLLAGHFASESFAMARMADLLSERLPGLKCWASRTETSVF